MDSQPCPLYSQSSQSELDPLVYELQITTTSEALEEVLDKYIKGFWQYDDELSVRAFYFALLNAFFVDDEICCNPKLVDSVERVLSDVKHINHELYLYLVESPWLSVLLSRFISREAETIPFTEIQFLRLALYFLSLEDINYCILDTVNNIAGALIGNDLLASEELADDVAINLLRHIVTALGEGAYFEHLNEENQNRLKFFVESGSNYTGEALVADSGSGPFEQIRSQIRENSLSRKK
ncbi:hypothetical protein HDE_03189 [Halotydeus destructor]|nr:hypothetical protein HDE_03189 [Halotydeus destructor]